MLLRNAVPTTPPLHHAAPVPVYPSCPVEVLARTFTWSGWQGRPAKSEGPDHTLLADGRTPRCRIT